MKLLLIIALMLLIPLRLHASPLDQANPMTDCLNDKILPQLGSPLAAEEIVNPAFILCKPLIDRWLAAYPQPEKRQQLYRDLRQYYIALLNR